jgi:hypothetical protein
LPTRLVRPQIASDDQAAGASLADPQKCGGGANGEPARAGAGSFDLASCRRSFASLVAASNALRAA